MTVRAPADVSASQRCTKACCSPRLAAFVGGVRCEGCTSLSSASGSSQGAAAIDLVEVPHSPRRVQGDKPWTLTAAQHGPEPVSPAWAELPANYARQLAMTVLGCRPSGAGLAVAEAEPSASVLHLASSTACGPMCAASVEPAASTQQGQTTNDSPPSAASFSCRKQQLDKETQPRDIYRCACISHRATALQVTSPALMRIQMPS